MYDVITYKLERTCNNMKKAIFDVISNELAEYVGEEAEAKAKRNSVEVAIIACRAFDKSAKHDMHWSYTLRSMSKSIRGNHGVFKSRTGKASRLIKRAEKVTGGGFDYNEFY